MRQLTLRLPDDLHARLKDAAEGEHRSMHAEVLRAVERHLDQLEAERAARKPPS